MSGLSQFGHYLHELISGENKAQEEPKSGLVAGPGAQLGSGDICNHLVYKLQQEYGLDGQFVHFVTQGMLPIELPPGKAVLIYVELRDETEIPKWKVEGG